MKGANMTIYAVDDRFAIEPQADLALCWASTVKAVAGYMGEKVDSQETLANAYKNKTDGNDVRKVLQQEYGIDSNILLDWRKQSESSADDAMIQDLELNLKYHLDKPLLCGLTAANFNRIDNKPYRHATLIIGYDDVTQQVTIADPAQKNDPKLKVASRDLVRGFMYMKKSGLGPQASQRITSDSDNLLLKIYMLVEFDKKATP
ncbi:hypothetical protein BWR60_25225 [Inquilinus limosus]|uniref:Peptidase C39-like domain-containing protein n=2 Tax=Inquilinus limosus TaxID=171674 RepID=A0A211ZGU7_9PROT|nr:hypothetical protein BWR60_25225 [Inquilinus limosus]